MKTFNILILGLVVALGACNKKSSNSSNDPYYGYQQPQYAPPTHNWNSYQPGYVPPGNCGSYQTLPSGCHGTYNGYSYCNNQWYYGWNNTYWTFPAFGSCGNSGGGGYHGDDDWWDDDSSSCGSRDDDADCGGHDDDDDSHDDDDDDHNDISYSTGWKKLWNNMGSNQSNYITFKAPKSGTYYISFKGDYTGKSQDEEKLKVNFYNSNIHNIKDLDQSHTGSGEVTRNCKVNVNFKLTAGSTYKVYLKGNQDSVNNTYLRITNYWPSDISKLCN